jgi:hypothetical protein
VAAVNGLFESADLRSATWASAICHASESGSSAKCADWGLVPNLFLPDPPELVTTL